VPADGALQRRFQLAHEQVHDPRIVPPQVAPPRFRRFLTVTDVIGDVRVQRFDFDGHSVDIFVQSFEQIAQKFLRILLIVAHKSRGELLDLTFQCCGIDSAGGIAFVFIRRPQFTQHRRQSFDEGAVHGRCCGVDVASVLFGNDVIEHGARVTQTLKYRIHKTSVANVAESDETRLVGQSGDGFPTGADGRRRRADASRCGWRRR